MLNTLSYALFNAGDVPAAARVIEDAAAEAMALGNPHLVSMACGMRAVQRFIRGDGIRRDINEASDRGRRPYPQRSVGFCVLTCRTPCCSV